MLLSAGRAALVAGRAAVGSQMPRYRSEKPLPPTQAQKKAMYETAEFEMRMSKGGLVRRALEKKQAAKKWRRRKLVIRKKHEVELSEKDLWPVNNNPVAYCPSYEEADSLIGSVILDAEPLVEFVGLRTERRVNHFDRQRRYHRGAKHTSEYLFKQNPLAVITLSTPNAAIILHVAQWADDWCTAENMPSFFRLMQSTRIAKVASNASTVARGLHMAYGCVIENMIDIGVLAAGLMRDAGCSGVKFQPLGFTFPALAETFSPGFPLAPRMALTNWNILPLTPAQMCYTANMASGLIHAFHKLIRVRELTRVSPLGVWHMVYVVINSWTLRFPQQEPPDLPAIRDAFRQGSEFHETVRQTIQATFRDYDVQGFWFACTRQTVCVAFPRAEDVDEAIAQFAGHKSFLVTDRPVAWKDALEEFRLRLGGERKLLPSEQPVQHDNEWMQ